MQPLEGKPLRLLRLKQRSQSVKRPQSLILAGRKGRPVRQTFS